jgi:hypothetical protein
MTGISGEDEVALPVFDPKRKVYGIRILKRE